MSDHVSINVPMPPSVNATWRKGWHGGIHRSNKYQAWLNTVDGIVMAMVPRPRLEGPFHAVVTLNASKRRKNSDVDNRIKPCLDAMQRCGIIENDKLAESVTIQWGFAPDGCNIALTPVSEPNEVAHG